MSDDEVGISYNENDSSIISINFDIFVKFYDYYNICFDDECRFEEYRECIIKNIFTLLENEFKRLSNVNFSISKYIKNFCHFHMNDDFFILQMLMNYENIFIKKKKLEELIENRSILRKRMYEKYYKKFLICLLNALFGNDKDLNVFGKYNFKIYNYFPSLKKIKVQYPIYKDENYNLNTLELKSSVKEFLHFFNIFSDEVTDDMLDDLLIDKLVLFVEMYDIINNKLIFRFCRKVNNGDYRFKTLENAFINYPNELSVDDIQELKYFSGIEFEKVIEFRDKKVIF